MKKKRRKRKSISPFCMTGYARFAASRISASNCAPAASSSASRYGLCRSYSASCRVRRARRRERPRAERRCCCRGRSRGPVCFSGRTGAGASQGRGRAACAVPRISGTVSDSSRTYVFLRFSVMPLFYHSACGKSMARARCGIARDRPPHSPSVPHVPVGGDAGRLSAQEKRPACGPLFLDQ